MSTMIDYEKYTEDEIRPYIEQALETWVIPAIKNGKDYILTRDDLYADMVEKARVLHKYVD